MHQATKKAQPLIDAIEKYRDEKGQYPEKLDNLVPDYLEEIPFTGMCIYPEFAYKRIETVKCQPRKGSAWMKMDTGGYELYVDTARLLSFDSFRYWPSKSYPYYMYGGIVEQISSWAYVWE